MPWWHRQSSYTPLLYGKKIHAYLTKFVIARISGSFLYGLALGKKKKVMALKHQ